MVLSTPLLYGLVLGPGIAHAADVSAPGGFTSAPTAPAYAPVDGANPLVQVGGWTETVPLELPPGRGGAPPVALTADFHIPDGPLGPGWRLDGFSRIDRQSKTGGVPRLGPSDVFLVDGVRLYDDGAGYYRAERDDGRLFSRDAFQNVWKVQKDGWTWTYGETVGDGISRCAVEWQGESLADCEAFPGAGAAHAGDTTAWLLAKVEDPHGNVTTYQYMVPDEDVHAGADTDLDGDHAYVHLPESVSYGPTTIEFGWEARDDRRSDARSGRMRTTAARLAGIEVYANGESDFASAYAIQYLDDDVAGCPGEVWPYPQPELASVVHRVERLGTDGGSKTLRCVETNAEETSFGEWSAGPEWESTLADTRFTMMVVSDGDQYPDLLAYSGAPRPGQLPPTGNCVAPNPCLTGVSGTPTPVAVAWRNEAGTLVDDTDLGAWLGDVLDPSTFTVDGSWNITDIDRDGASDLLWADDRPSAVQVSPLGAGAFSALSITGAELIASKLGDIDGDGFPDLLNRDDGTWTRNTGGAPWLDSGTAVSAYWDWDDVLDFAAIDAECGEGNVLFGDDDTVPDPIDDPEWTLTQLVDVNGDGLGDLLFSGTPCWHEEAIQGFGTELVRDGGLVQAVLLGDGQGNFSPAGYTAGGSSIAVWHPDFDLSTDSYATETTQWTTADVDHSGRVEVIDGLSVYPDRGLPAGFGFDDASAESVGGVSVLGMALSDSAGSNAPADQFLFADWDADGFTDVLHVVPPAQTSGATSPAVGAIELAQGERAVSRHRVTKIHGPWGGATTLTYGFTDPALNPNLHAPMEVIASVTAADGTTEYAFEGGTWWAAQNRFIGFEDALLVGESGASTHYRFAISPWFNGDYVFKVVQRPDGTLAHFTWRSAQLPQGFVSTIDNVAPYFNPTRRVCDVEVGEGYSSGGAMHQTVSEISLAEQCEEADGHPNFGGATWEALYGWKTDFESPVDRDVSNTVWGLLLQNGTPAGPPCDPQNPCGNDPNNPGGNNNPPCDPSDPNNPCPVNNPPPPCAPGDPNNPCPVNNPPPPCAPGDPNNPCPVNNPPPCDRNGPNNPCITNPGTVAGSNGAYSFNASQDGPFADWHIVPARYGIVIAGQGEPGEYGAMQGAVPDEIVIPTTPEAPTTDHGMLITKTQIYVTDWSYDADHRVGERKDLRDLAQPADNLKTIYSWEGWDPGHAGKQLDGWEVQDSTGATVGWVGRLAFSDWDTPTTLRDRLGPGREWHYTYDHGDLLAQSDPDGVSESWTRNAMGQVLTRTDPSGRVETFTYDFAGRQWLWEWEGASTNVTMDEFGREQSKLSCTDSGTSACITESWLRDDAFDHADDRGTWSEPRAIVERGDGSMRLLFLDPWGRQSLAVDCSEGAATSSDGGSLLSAVGCVPGTEIEQFQAWAEDGTPRVTSRTFAPGDPDVAGTWTYSDSLGRPSETLTPAPDPSPGRFVSSFTSYGVGDVTTEGPTGYACTTSTSTLYSSTECAGDFQSGQTLDSLGRVTRTEDANHTTWRTEYDAWGRATRRVLDGTVSLWDGSSRSPETRWTYTDGDRVLTEQDADGNWTETHYRTSPNDGRVASVELHPNFGPAETVKTYSYSDHSTPNSRSVSQTDVDGNVQTTWLDGFDRSWRHVDPDFTFTTTSWNSRGQVASSTNVLGVTTTPSYDAAGRMYATTRTDATSTSRACVLDSTGQATSCADETGAIRSTDYAWNGAVLQRRLGAHVLGTTAYEDDGRVLSNTGTSTTTYAYDAHRRPQVVCEGFDGTDCGVETSYAYDGMGRVLSETWSTPTDAPATRQYQRNPLGWQDRTIEPDGAPTVFGYDVLGRTRRVVDPDGAMSQADFDAYNRPTQTQQPGQGWTVLVYPSHHETEVHAPDGGIWTSQTDWAGREVESERPDGIRTQTTYAGPLLDEVDVYDASAAMYSRQRFGYDARGRMAWRWGPYDASNTDTEPVEGVETAWFYAYDDAGRTTQIRGPNDQTDFAYDSDGVIESESALGVTRHDYGFNPNGTELWWESTGDSTTPDYRVHDYYYDPRGLHVETEEWLQGGDSKASNYSAWDASGTPRYASSVRNGVLEWQQGLTTDVRGRVTSSLTDAGMGAMMVQYQYTAGSRVQHVQTPAQAWTYSYSAGVLDRMQIDAGPVIAEVHNRDALGRAIDISLNMGGHVQRGFTWSGDIATEQITASNGDVTQLDYEYDDLGRMSATEQSGTLGTRRDEYLYSVEGWLVHEDQDVTGPSPKLTDYGYDIAGNRLSRVRTDGTSTETTAWLYATGNELQSVQKDGGAVEPLTWNGLGEVTDLADGTAIDRYPDGSESAVVGATAIADITRDAYGRPAVIDDGGVTPTMQVWGNPGADLPLTGMDADGNLFANLAIEGMLVGEVHGGVLTVAATDAHGDLALTGNTELMGRPGAFGDDADLPTTSANRYRWGGQAQLAGSRLQLARHRLYDPDAGRWLSADPIGLAGGGNRFGFVGNAPLTGVDPSGYVAETLQSGSSASRSFVPCSAGDQACQATHDRHAGRYPWLNGGVKETEDTEGAGEGASAAAQAETTAESSREQYTMVGDGGLNAPLKSTGLAIFDDAAVVYGESGSLARGGLTLAQFEAAQADNAADVTTAAGAPAAAGDVAGAPVGGGDTASQAAAMVGAGCGGPTPVGARSGFGGGGHRAGPVASAGDLLTGCVGSLGSGYSAEIGGYESIAADLIHGARAFEHLSANPRTSSMGGRMAAGSIVIGWADDRLGLSAALNRDAERRLYAAGQSHPNAALAGMGMATIGALVGQIASGEAEEAMAVEGMEGMAAAEAMMGRGASAVPKELLEEGAEGVASNGSVVFKHRPTAGNGHHSMEVLDAGGNSLGDFEQVVVGKGKSLEGRSTEIRQVGAGSSPVRSGGTSRAFPVDNTQAVLDELGSSQFPYAQGSNSCIHALCRAAIAGGAYLPSTGSGQTAAVKAATGAR